MDLCHIYGLRRAGYTPQLVSLRLPNPDVVYELLKRANAKALIHDASFSTSVAYCPIPTLTAADARGRILNDVLLPNLAEEVDEHDTAMIFHTSGSTSGSPKLVPCSYRWLDSMVAKATWVSKPRSTTQQDVTVWM